jgi:hypothetical protein
MNFSIKAKKVLSSVMALALLTAGASAADTSIVKNIIPTNTLTAEAVTPNAKTWGQWKYIIKSSTTCYVAGYTGKDKVIFVPETINGYVVKGVAESAFAGETGRTELKLPRGATDIGDYAFAYSSFNRIVIPEGTTEIGDYACYYAKNLTDFNIPNVCRIINQHAFEGTKITRFISPYVSRSELGWVGIGAFANTPLNTLTLNGRWSVCGQAFANCKNLYNVEMNEDAFDSAIGNGAFQNCTNLTYVNGLCVWSTKAGQPYIVNEKHRVSIGRYSYRLLSDNIGFYNAYYRALHS